MTFNNLATKIAISFNILCCGFQPTRPLHCQDEFNSGNPLDVSTEPLAVQSDGKLLQCRLTEVRGDWKWIKDEWWSMFFCLKFEVSDHDFT